jgi:hypothetical protein
VITEAKLDEFRQAADRIEHRLAELRNDFGDNWIAVTTSDGMPITMTLLGAQAALLTALAAHEVRP